MKRSKGRDYRTKAYRNSPFAPKNNKGGMTPVGAAAAIPLLIAYGLYATQSPLVQSTVGFAVIGGILFVMFIALLILVLHWEQRVIRGRIKDEFSFETDPESNRHMPVDKAFEHEVAQLIQTTTGKTALVCGGSGDGGVDIEVFDPAGRVVGIVQCKAFLKAKALPPQYVRELYAVKIQRGVSSAYLVTTAHFSKNAQLEADKLGIRLMDGTSLDNLRKKSRAAQTAAAR